MPKKQFPLSLSPSRLALELAGFAHRAKLRPARRKGKFGQTGDGIKAAKTVHASAISPRGQAPSQTSLLYMTILPHKAGSIFRGTAAFPPPPRARTCRFCAPRKIASLTTQRQVRADRRWNEDTQNSSLICHLPEGASPLANFTSPHNDTAA